jgi:ATP-dependent RNA helicase DHX8/PRP22
LPVEFLADQRQLHETNKTFDAFQTKLNAIGAEFPPWFVKNLDRLIVTMHPKYKRKAAKLKAAKAKGNGVGMGDEEKDVKARKFPGLSLPDQEWKPVEAYDLDVADSTSKLPSSISVEDTMSQLAAVAARRNRPAAEDFIGGEPSNKRPRHGDRDPEEGSSRREEDRRSRDGGYSGDNGYGRDNGYGSRSSHTYNDRGRSGRGPELDDHPILYKIYNGVVNNVRDFGAFVILEGIKGRTEGKPPFTTPE